MKTRIAVRSYRKPDTRYSPIDLVVCEGETEIDYFSELAKKLRVYAHICKGEGTDPKSIVNTAKSKSKEGGVNYDQMFCVFDRDHNPSAFLQAIESCKAKRIIPIFSNPCFELWPLLHFQMCDSGLGNPQQVLRALKKAPGFAKYDKDGVSIFNLTSHLLDVACKRSSALLSRQNNDPREDPCTNVHLLIERFQYLSKAQNYFGTKKGSHQEDLLELEFDALLKEFLVEQAPMLRRLSKK